MRRTAILLAGFAILLTVGATAQESGSEISVQGTGFFTKETNGQGISRTTTDAGGFQVGYRYNFNLGSRQKPTMVTAEILKNMSAPASGNPESRPTCTPPREMWW